ncbi:hypothetical protein XENTR_v10005018 [Xenopus tropicalis]|nr:hypothetical protein XENTR_v10005018 [Xenopus tropicalis]
MISFSLYILHVQPHYLYALQPKPPYFSLSSPLLCSYLSLIASPIPLFVLEGTTNTTCSSRSCAGPFSLTVLVAEREEQIDLWASPGLRWLYAYHRETVVSYRHLGPMDISWACNLWCPVSGSAVTYFHVMQWSSTVCFKAPNYTQKHCPIITYGRFRFPLTA